MGAFEGELCLLDYVKRETRQQVDQRLQRGVCFSQMVSYVQREDPLFHSVRQQLEEYLTGQRAYFDLPLRYVGTDFQRSVWYALTTIPYGSTCSYLDVAHQIGRPQSVRAVANAIGANALSLVIPCHRVIASSGQLGGYAGGVKAKRTALSIEKKRT